MTMYMGMVDPSHTGSGSGTDLITISPGGGQQSRTFQWHGGNTSDTVYLDNVSFTVAASATSQPLYCYIQDENTGSTTIYFDPATSPPTGLGANNLVPGAESFTANVYISGWGTGGTSAGRYRELQCWTYDASSFVQPRRYQPVYGDSLSGNITVSNSSSYSQAYGPLNITGNTRYTLGLYATNGAVATDSQRYTNAVTLAYAPEMTPSVVDDTTVTVNYTTKADGGYYSKTYEYSIDGGTTWTTFATVATGAASSGSFNLTGLTYGTEYTLLSRVTTTAGTNTGMPIKFSTKSKPKVYGSVSGSATRISKLYGSRRIMTQLNADTTPTYNMIVSIDQTAFKNKYNEWAMTKGLTGSDDDQLERISFFHRSDGVNLYEFSLAGHFGGGNRTYVIKMTNFSTVQATAAEWGITITTTSSYVNDQMNTSPDYAWQAQGITKIYGSVGGVAKRIY